MSELTDELAAFLQHAIRLVMMTPRCACWDEDEHRDGGHTDECQYALVDDVMGAAGKLVQLKPESQAESAEWARQRLSGDVGPSWPGESGYEDFVDGVLEAALTTKELADEN